MNAGTRAASMVAAAALVTAAALLVSACGSDDNSGGSHKATDGGTDGFSSTCPDPNNPSVHYVSQDPNTCMPPDQLVCTDTQYGFYNGCGCGCIDKGDGGLCPTINDPQIIFWSRDPTQCTGLPVCPLGETPFNNSCGCGCIIPG